MELAINTFQKGLQMDTHPMVQGTDTLSDALNATFVTMNGNEVILQNDMGNRRVDNAFLPSGYTPVGIKEYGGIIYIAAYNPITDMSLIGSFPSPERRIGEGDTNLGCNLNLTPGDLGSFKVELKNGKKYLVEDTILLSLSNSMIIHAGDKFYIYESNFLTEDKITDYGTYKLGQDYIGKNKSYTLSIGILNSQNEFVNITKTLKEWDIGGGTYFIAKGAPSNWSSSETIADGTLIQERENNKALNTMLANTYSYKLVGPMYLQAKLNHFDEFNYNIYGEKVGDNVYNIYIEGYFTYNCPDDITNVNSPKWFKLDNQNGNYISIESSYNENNTYYSKVVKKFSISGSGYYDLDVFANNDLDIFIKSLSTTIYIDVDKFGSNTIDIEGYRFTNLDGNTTLTYSFDYYPLYSELGNLLTIKLKFYDVEGNESNTIYGPVMLEEDSATMSNRSRSTITENPVSIMLIPLYNGRNTVQIDWSTYGLKERKLYRVDICKRIQHGESISIDDKVLAVRWLLTTKLMNTCYYPTSSYYIRDYGNPKSESEINTLNERLTICPDLEYTYNDRSYLTEASINLSSLISQSNDTSKTEVFDNVYTLNVSISSTIKYDKELYPKYIEDNISIVENSNSFSFSELNFDNENAEILDNCIERVTDSSIKFSPNEEFISKNNISITDNILTGTITFKDKFKYKLILDSNNSIQVNNIFGSIETGLRASLLDSSNSLPGFGGITLKYWSRNGKDRHYLCGIKRRDSYKFSRKGEEDGPPDSENFQEFAHETLDKVKIFRYEDSRGYIQDFLNSEYGKNDIFLICFHDTSVDNGGNVTCYNRGSNPEIRNGDYSRIWWRSASNNWAVCNKLFHRTKSSNWEISSELIDFIVHNYFGENYIYCYRKTATLNNLGLKIPDKNNYTHNNSYKINKDLKAQANNVQFNLLNNYEILCKDDNENKSLIKFETKLLDIKIISIPIIYKSNSDFLDIVNTSFDNIYYDNIYISDSGKIITSDINGYRLLPSKIYRHTFGNNVDLSNPELKLQEVPNYNIEISDEFGPNRGEYNTILYGNKITQGVPENVNDFVGGTKTDSHTYLNYSDFNIAKLL